MTSIPTSGKSLEVASDRKSVKVTVPENPELIRDFGEYQPQPVPMKSILEQDLELSSSEDEFAEDSGVGGYEDLTLATKEDPDTRVRKMRKNLVKKIGNKKKEEVNSSKKRKKYTLEEDDDDKQAIIEEEEEEEEGYKEGDLVWAKYSRYPPWPALVRGDQRSSSQFLKLDRVGRLKVRVLFLEDKYQVAWLSTQALKKYSPPKNFSKAVSRAVPVANTLFEMSGQERIQYYQKSK